MSNALSKYISRLENKAKADVSEVSVGTADFTKALSHQGGVLSIDDAPLPGNIAVCIIVSSVRTRKYYLEKFEKGKSNKPPKCFAFQKDPMEPWAPHEVTHKKNSYFEDQSPDGVCASCKNNMWGSAGRGKACKEGRDLELLIVGSPVLTAKGNLTDDIDVEIGLEDLKKLELVKLRIPVTSLKNWARYVTDLNSEHGLPSLAFVTIVSVGTDGTNSHVLKFEKFIPIEDDGAIGYLLDLHDRSMLTIDQPFSEPMSE